MSGGYLNHGRALRVSAMRYRDRPALEFLGATWTYGELDRQVNATARALAERGLRPGQGLMIMSPNSPEVVRLLFAAARLGAVCIPTNTSLPEPAVAAVIAAARPSLVVAADGHWPTVTAAASLATMDKPPIALIDEVDGTGHDGDPLPDPSTSDDDPAVLLFTSGSTGTPKAVVKSFGNLTWHALNRQLSEPRREGDRELFVLPLSGVGFGNFLLTDLLTGATCVLEPSFDPVRAAEQLGRGITHVFLAPTMMLAIDAARPGSTFPGVSVVETAYEITVPQRHRVAEMFPDARILYSYGCTEGSMARAPAESFLGEPSCVGFASGFDEYRVMPQGDDPPSTQTPGAIEVGGPTVMRGYLDGEGGPADGWFDTGDLGWVDDAGRLHFTGRRKDMIKTGAMNVFARDVEEALADHPDIAATAVVGVPDEYWGEAVVAVVQPRPGSTPGLADLRAFVAARLAGYQRPKAYYATAELPLNATGKVVKARLREWVLTGRLEPLSTVDYGNGSGP